MFMEKKEFTPGNARAAAVAFVVGLVVYVGVSASAPSSSLFALRSMQAVTSIAPVTTSTSGTVTSVPREVSDRRAQARAPKNAQGDSVEATTSAKHGFGLPLVLAGLSMVLLGMASWLVKPRRHVAMAFASGTRLQAANDAAIEAPEKPLKIVDSVQAMLTPLGYYEAYELVVVVSPRMTELEKEDRLATLEALFTQNKCKKVEKLDRGRRLLAYPIKGSIEAYIVLYTFKGPRTMPKIIDDWFVGPGLNSDGSVFRCFLCKQRRVKKGAAMKQEDATWTV